MATKGKPKMIRPSEYAKLHGVTKQTVLWWIKERYIPFEEVQTTTGIPSYLVPENAPRPDPEVRRRAAAKRRKIETLKRKLKQAEEEIDE